MEKAPILTATQVVKAILKWSNENHNELPNVGTWNYIILEAQRDLCHEYYAGEKE